MNKEEYEATFTYDGEKGRMFSVCRVRVMEERRARRIARQHMEEFPNPVLVDFKKIIGNPLAVQKSEK